MRRFHGQNLPEFTTYGARRHDWYLGVAERTTRLGVLKMMKEAPQAMADGSPEFFLRRRAPVDLCLDDLVHEKQKEGSGGAQGCKEGDGASGGARGVLHSPEFEFDDDGSGGWRARVRAAQRRGVAIGGGEMEGRWWSAYRSKGGRESCLNGVD